MSIESFDETLFHSDLPVLVFFFNEGMPSVQKISGLLAETEPLWQGRWILVCINIRIQPMLALNYGVTAAPSLLLFHRGKLLDSASGCRSEKLLKHWIFT